MLENYIQKSIFIFFQFIRDFLGLDLYDVVFMKTYLGQLMLAKYYERKYRVKVVLKKKYLEVIKNKRKILLSTAHIHYIAYLNFFYNCYFKVLKALREDGYQVLDFSKPNLHTYKKAGLSFYFSSLPEDEWEIKEYTRLYKIRPGDIVFDLGAYCGYSVYGFSKLVGKNGKVYAFEPDSENFQILIKNIKRHNLKNVVPLKKGIWSETTSLEFYTEGSLGSSVKEVEFRSISTKSRRSNFWSLEDAYRFLKLDKINFIKMDIEGAEVETIKGATDFIKWQNIHFAISAHQMGAKYSYQMSHDILKKIFKSIGYQTIVKKMIYGDYPSYILYARKIR